MTATSYADPSTFSGGGIVFDSDPYDEYMETMNKLASNIRTIDSAEKQYARLQKFNGAAKGVEQEGLAVSRPKEKVHIDLAAG